MRAFLKKILTKLPKIQQNQLRRFYYHRLIKKKNFISKEPEFRNLNKYVKNGDWVIDIGANIGHYTLKLAELVGVEGRVISFEPIPDTFEILTSNIYYSKHNNISLLNIAVSNESGLGNMEIPDFDNGLKNYYNAHLTKNDSEESDESVLCIPIDALKLPELPTLIKIDVEGHEIKVLEGMKNLIKKKKPVLIIEGPLSKYDDILKPLGYKGYQNESSPNCVYEPVG